MLATIIIVLVIILLVVAMFNEKAERVGEFLKDVRNIICVVVAVYIVANIIAGIFSITFWTAIAWMFAAFLGLVIWSIVFNKQ
ncbi:MAG: hypothetical protein VZR95_04370 [Alphaproteobacteria bacterium]